ncbi:MAG: RHS repeat-associated core domain-containing protein [Ktedonobacteraceae bacterium]
MSQQHDAGSQLPHSASISPLEAVLPYFRRYWSVSTIARLFFTFLMTSTFVIGSWAASTTHAQAATASAVHPAIVQTHASRLAPAAPLMMSSSGTLDGNGETGFYTYFGKGVNDHLKVEVNVGNGNLVVHASDLHIQGTKLDLSIERFYNAQSSSTRVTDLAPHWSLSTGADVFLQFNGDGSITFFGPSGGTALFNPTGTGSFFDPLGLNATLTKPGSSYQLTFHKNGEVLLFDSSGRLTNDKEKNGDQISFSYNGSTHQLTSLTDTQGRITTFSYNGSGELSTITDPSGRKVQYAYDGSGNLSRSTDMAGQITSYTYAAGSATLVKITDPANHVIQIAYNGNQVATLTDATGAQTSFAYSSGQSVVTDARGNKTTYQVDSTSRVTQATDALGRNRSVQYSPNDDVTMLMDELGNTSQFQFDANSNITSTTEATGAKSSFTYQDGTHAFYPTGSTDAQGSSLAYTYDSPGNITSAKNVTSGGAGETTTSTYNSNGTIASMTDGNGNKSTYSYDNVGNLVKITPPSPLGATTLHQDALSRTTSLTDGDGNTTSYTYDALDRITKITYADSSTISYVRDASGNVTSFTDNTGTTTFHYDAANRLTQKVIPNSATLTYTYDVVGNALSFTDASGTVSYSYNTVNLITSLTDPSGAKTTYGYDNKNQRTSVNYPNGVVMSLTYDSAGHETSIIARHGSTTLSGYNYTYGTTDLRQNMTDQVTGLVSTYHYDSMNRLTLDAVTQGSTQVNDFQYNYDKAGNRTSQTINGSQTSYSYNAANELTQQGSLNYSYDGNGNLTQLKIGAQISAAYSYNVKNQMVSFQKGTTKNIDLTYTGPDQTERVSFRFTTFVNAPFGVSSQNDPSSGTTYFTRESNGNLVSERTSAGTFYYLFDGLGSVVGLTDSNGNLVGNERYVYDPYGNIINTVNSPQMQSNPWRFGSGYTDGFTGLTKFGIRYDDTSTGRWTQHTPIGGSLAETIKANPYVYVGNNPVNITDPSGRCGTFGGITFNHYWWGDEWFLPSCAAQAAAIGVAVIPIIGTIGTAAIGFAILRSCNGSIYIDQPLGVGILGAYPRSAC